MRRRVLRKFSDENADRVLEGRKNETIGAGLAAAKALNMAGSRVGSALEEFAARYELAVEEPTDEHEIRKTLRFSHRSPVDSREELREVLRDLADLFKRNGLDPADVRFAKVICPGVGGFPAGMPNWKVRESSGGL